MMSQRDAAAPTLRFGMSHVSKGGAPARLRACPKCGPEAFLVERRGRGACGRCGYVEF